MAWYDEYYESGYALNSEEVHVSSAGHQERSIIFNYGQIDQYSETINCFQYTDKIDEPSSMTDLTKYLKFGSISSLDVTYVYNDVFNNPQSDEYYNTETYASKKALVDRYVGWIIGDSDHPGMCIFRDSNYHDRITLYICYGFFQRNDLTETDNIKGYWFGYLGEYSEDQMKKVFFTWDAQAKETLDVYGYQKALKMNYRLDPTSNNYGFAQHAMDGTSVPQDFYIGGGSSTFDIYTTINPTYEGGYLMGVYPVNVCWGNLQARDLFNVHTTGANLTLIGESAMDDANLDPESDPYSGGGLPTTGGGGGSYPDDTAEVDIPDPTGLPSLVNSGLVKLYNPTASQIQDFTNFLFSGITESIENTIKKLTTEPLQYVIGMYLTRFQPAVSSNSNIKFAGVDTGASSAVIVNQFQQLDCGYIDIPNASKTHLDYSPYSSAVLYLPYIGYREINIDEVMGSRLIIKYNIDLVTGSCTAFVKVSRAKRTTGDAKLNDVLYEFQGNCFVQCPLSSKDSAGTISALASFASAVGAAATHNVAGMLSGVVDAVATEKVGVNRNGSPSANYGYSSIQKPYVVLQRPLDKVPEKFSSFEGWTSHMRKRLSSLKGYTEVDNNTVWTDNIMCSEAEANEIRELFNTGVYL